MNNEEIITELAEKIINSSLIRLEDIPKIDLYMEQTISFLEQEMGDSLRRKDETVFTKTMINNYVKFDILARPEKKKYNKEHIISLVYIFLLKQILTIQDIKSFFSLLDGDEDETARAEKLEELYSVFFEITEELRKDMASFMKQHLDKIDAKLTEHGVDDERMKIMSMISVMALEANINKMICGQLLDSFAPSGDDETEAEKPDKSEKHEKREKEK